MGSEARRGRGYVHERQARRLLPRLSSRRPDHDLDERERQRSVLHHLPHVRVEVVVPGRRERAAPLGHRLGAAAPNLTAGVQYDAVTVSLHRDLGRLFKAYDVRGVVPDELDEDLARSIGAAFAEWSGVEAVAIGRDCRLTSRGADVIDIGLASTDLLYFTSGSRSVAGIMLTASHNPPEYNGMKFCLPG